MNPLALIAEDDKDIADILRAYLEREGFRTVQASNGRTALDVHLALRPDILLLDITMPVVDGWEVLSEVRRRGGTPVIVITALDQDLDKLLALRVGADDYVIKPFNPVEVVARAKAVLRRAAGLGVSGVQRIGAVEIDTTSHIVRVEDREVALTLTEFRLLAHMARNPTQVFTRGDLVDACMPGSDALDRTVDSHVSKLRRKLHQAGAPDMPEGVRGVGYRLTSRA
ncbi:response regulator [uncultured Reyranella sp.]|uniref:response regulator n=1 Tax=uncultured Reyranella sp. TaxID=735512 RepID=UPI0025FF452A|nr:response regulator [uncultured Reyranella sp.]